jgi:acetyl esterase/lipase
VTRGRQAVTRSIVARALLVALAVVVLVPAALPVVGAFLPQLTVVGRFGLFIIEDLHGVALLALVTALLSWGAWRLGRSRATTMLLAVSMALVVGVVGITASLLQVASSNGATFDLVRQAAAPPEVRAPNERARFATVDGQDLYADVYLPLGRQIAAAGPVLNPVPRAAVLFLHGGGFWGGGLGSRRALFTALANAGYVVVDAEYRLSPPPRWDQAPGDALCALGWVQGQASAFGFDANKVVVIGESAGGYLALMTAYTAGTDRGQSSCGGTPARPAGVIAISPTADLEGIWQDGSLSNDGVLFPEAYMGGTPLDQMLRYDDMEPMNLVRPDVPPTLVLVAANDHLVHPRRSLAITDALRQAGATYELIVVPFADHGFDGASNAFGEQLEESIFPAFIEANT